MIIRRHGLILRHSPACCSQPERKPKPRRRQRRRERRAISARRRIRAHDAGFHEHREAGDDSRARRVHLPGRENENLLHGGGEWRRRALVDEHEPDRLAGAENHFRPPPDIWGGIQVTGIWAPELHEYKGKYYLFLTLTRGICWGSNGTTGVRA